MKRLFDIFFALILMALTSPLWIILIIAIPLTSPGGPFFSHPRVGRSGRQFRLIKFRSMCKPQPGDPCITVKGDKRVTGLGRLIRKLKLDELPQLLNILIGQMSFVGPRPESPEYVAAYLPEQMEILAYCPGLVDPATLKYRHEESLLAGYPDPPKAYREIILPDKLKISLEYQKSRTFATDLKVLLETIAAICRFG